VPVHLARLDELIDERLLATSWRPALALRAGNLAFAGLVVLLGRCGARRPPASVEETAR
jgi:hypothetical protein